MKIRKYIEESPDRLSSNFFALLAFVNFSCLIIEKSFIKALPSMLTSDFILNTIASCLICAANLGITSLPAIFLLSIPFFTLLLSKRKSIILISIICFILIFAAILVLSQRYGIFSDFSTLIGLVTIYGSYSVYYFLIYLCLLIFCIIDNKKQFQIKNTRLISNKYYRLWVKIFYCYFWILYIPFILGITGLTIFSIAFNISRNA